MSASKLSFLRKAQEDMMVMMPAYGVPSCSYLCVEDESACSDLTRVVDLNYVETEQKLAELYRKMYEKKLLEDNSKYARCDEVE